MRTTIDLPDELFRRAKARAALDGLKLKELIAEYVERGLEAAANEEQAARVTARRRSPLPVIPKAAAGGTIPALTNAEMQAILDEEDAEQARRLAGSFWARGADSCGGSGPSSRRNLQQTDQSRITWDDLDGAAGRQRDAECWRLRQLGDRHTAAGPAGLSLFVEEGVLGDGEE